MTLAMAGTGELPATTIGICFTLGVIGSLLPDVDADNSIPVRITFNLLAISSGFLITFALRDSLPLTRLWLLAMATVIIVRYPVFELFRRYTCHRGLIHSIPMAVLLAQITAVTGFYGMGSSPRDAWLYGGFLFAGFITHLLLDELFSVNLLGQRIKKSFGSAMSLGNQKQPLLTLSLYGIIIILASLTPVTQPFGQFVERQIEKLADWN